MSLINIKVMSDEVRDALKLEENKKFALGKLIENPCSNKWLHDFFPGQIYVYKPYYIEDFQLQVPRDKYDKETEIKNAILLYESLKNLPRFILADERFWLWINFEKGYEVALKYIPPALDGTGKNTFSEHWLFKGSVRRGIYFGVLSRVFMRMVLTVDESLPDKYELSKFAIEKPERVRPATFRNYSDLEYVTRAMVRAQKRFVEKYKFDDISNYHKVIPKFVSELSSANLLDSMPEKEIEDYVYKRYKELVEMILGQVLEP